jgi:glycine/D-amino acid oxidase-like deaminating enzyme
MLPPRASLNRGGGMIGRPDLFNQACMSPAAAGGMIWPSIALLDERGKPGIVKPAERGKTMDLRSGHPYWLLRNGLLHAFAPLEKNESCDVAVVGAGITGALVAWHLAEAGFDTVVLDRRDVAWGSTAASTALLQYEIDTPLTELMTQHGEDHAVRAFLACRDAIYKLAALNNRLTASCDFALHPSIQIAPTRKAERLMLDEFELRRQHGFKVTWLKPEDLQKRFGFERPGAIRSQDGAQVDPYRLTYQLLMQGHRKKLRVHDRTEITDYDLRARSAVLRTDRGFSLRCKHVVFATGYEVAEILSRKIVTLRSTFAFVSEPFECSPWLGECLFWERADPYLYFRTTSDHRIIVGGEDEPFVSAEKRDALLPAKTKTLLRKFARYFPKLAPEVAFAWAGTFGETKDGLAYIGQVPEYRRAFFTLGFGGNGITYSILAAEIIRDRLRKIRSPYEGLFDFDR